MRKKVFSFIAIAASALSACAVPANTSVAGQSQSSEAVPITQMSGSWVLIEMRGRALGANIVQPSLNIDGAGVHGSSGCNNYFGTLNGTMASLSFDQMGATKMACLDTSRLVDEQSYFNVLNAAKSARMNGNEMSLFDASGAKIAVFTRTLD